MTSLRENLSVAMTSILANKFRSVLTMLGIIIGIGAVITIVSLGSAQGKQMQDQMNNEGFANIDITAKPKEGTEQSEDHPIKIDKELLQNVYKKHSDQCEGICISYDLTRDNDFTEYYIKTKKASRLVGFTAVNSGYFKAYKRDLTYGTPITPSEYKYGNHVIIISEDIAKALFGKASEECIGKTVETYFSNAYSTFTIKGIFKQQDRYDSTGYADPVTGEYVFAPYAFFPLTAYQNLSGSSSDFEACKIIPKQGLSGDEIIELMNSIQADMSAGADDYVDYKVDSMVEYINQTSQMIEQQVMTTALVAAIALLVGGIGVMNIMMVSIMERTREIGTRKALGATNASLLGQFITEAILLCLIGGIIGIIIGIIGGIVACSVSNLPYVLNPLSVIISLIFSMLIGAFFGYYPASKAAKMDPIEALRYE